MRRPWWTVAVALATLGALMVGSSASAAPPPTPNTVYWTGDTTLTYDAGIGRTNTLSVTAAAYGYEFDDTSKIVPGYGCYYTTSDTTIVVCYDLGTPGHVQSLNINLSNLDDTLHLMVGFNSYTNVNGGSGDDTLWFGVDSGPVVRAKGDIGNDYLIQLGAANTHLDGGPGADGMCGSGHTYITYTNSPSGISGTLDGLANDGAAGEGDALCPSITGIVGSRYDDYLVAALNPISFSGGAGMDTLLGSNQADDLDGGDGNDTLAGWGGDDTLTGGDGMDQFDGGTGIDECDQIPGEPAVSCES